MRFRLPILILSLAGIAVSSYLAYAYLSDTPVRCAAKGLFSGCVDVQKSEYAKFFGVPIPLFGMLFYLFLAAGCLWGVALFKRVYALRSFVWFVTFFGFMFSLYLTFIEAFVISAWCVWCVVSALISTAIFVLMTIEAMVHPKTQTTYNS